MYRVIGLLAFWGATVVIAGCAWSSKPPPPAPPTPKNSFKTAKVISLFRHETGKKLEVDSSSAVLEDALSLGDKDTNDPEFGSFVLFVTHSGAGVKHLLSDKQQRPLPQSKDGFYWTQQLGSTKAHPKWQATKKYGGNLYLTFFGGNPANRDSLPDTYLRLNRVLARLADKGS